MKITYAIALLSFLTFSSGNYETDKKLIFTHETPSRFQELKMLSLTSEIKLLMVDMSVISIGQNGEAIDTLLIPNLQGIYLKKDRKFSYLGFPHAGSMEVSKEGFFQEPTDQIDLSKPDRLRDYLRVIPFDEYELSAKMGNGKNRNQVMWYYSENQKHSGLEISSFFSKKLSNSQESPIESNLLKIASGSIILNQCDANRAFKFDMKTKQKRLIDLPKLSNSKDYQMLLVDSVTEKEYLLKFEHKTKLYTLHQFTGCKQIGKLVYNGSNGDIDIYDGRLIVPEINKDETKYYSYEIED